MRAASALGKRVGEGVGLLAPFDSRIGPETKILFTTHDTLLLSLLTAPKLGGASLLMVFGAERGGAVDFLLSFVHRARRQRPSMRVFVGASTPECAELWATALAAPAVRLGPVPFPVAIRHAAAPVRDVVEAVAELARTQPQPPLVFAPHGLASLIAERCGPAVRVAVEARGDTGRVVIDTGLADAPDGVRAVTRSEAAARARAAALWEDGQCVRLYTEEHARGLDTTLPPPRGLGRLLLLSARLLGRLHLPDPLRGLALPVAYRASDAVDELVRQGALRRADGCLRLTPALGKALSYLPLPPAVGKLFVAGCALERAGETAAIAAFLLLRHEPLYAQPATTLSGQRARSLFAAREGDHLTLLNVLDFCATHDAVTGGLRAATVARARAVQLQIVRFAPRVRPFARKLHLPEPDDVLGAAVLYALGENVAVASGRRARDGHPLFRNPRTERSFAIGPNSALYGQDPPPAAVCYADPGADATLSFCVRVSPARAAELRPDLWRCETGRSVRARE